MTRIKRIVYLDGKQTTMKKILLLTVVFIAAFSALNAQCQELEGKWILKDLKTDATIYVSKTKSESKAIGTNIPETPPETTPIKLRAYLLNEMSLDVTKFIFKNEKFEFYRKSELTFSGTYKIINEVVILSFTHKGVDNSKEMKLISVTKDEMILESNSHNRPFTLIFKR